MKTSVRRFLALSLSLAVLATMAPRVHADDGAEVRRAFRSEMKSDNWKERRSAFVTLLDYDFEKSNAGPIGELTNALSRAWVAHRRGRHKGAGTEVV